MKSEGYFTSELPPSTLLKTIAYVEAESSSISAKLIASGRGHERPSETRDKTDPLSLRWKEVGARLQTLRAERERRMNYHGSLKRIPQPVY